MAFLSIPLLLFASFTSLYTLPYSHFHSIPHSSVWDYSVTSEAKGRVLTHHSFPFLVLWFLRFFALFVTFRILSFWFVNIVGEGMKCFLSSFSFFFHVIHYTNLEKRTNGKDIACRNSEWEKRMERIIFSKIYKSFIISFHIISLPSAMPYLTPLHLRVNFRM